MEELLKQRSQVVEAFLQLHADKANLNNQVKKIEDRMQMFLEDITALSQEINKQVKEKAETEKEKVDVEG